MICSSPGSIGRTDLPGGSYETILASLARVCLPLPDETVVLAGHGPGTTIGAERAHNPFLAGLTPASGRPGRPALVSGAQGWTAGDWPRLPGRQTSLPGPGAIAGAGPAGRRDGRGRPRSRPDV